MLGIDMANLYHSVTEADPTSKTKHHPLLTN